MDSPIEPGTEYPEVTYTGPEAAVRLYRMALSRTAGMIGTEAADRHAYALAEEAQRTFETKFGGAPADLRVTQSRISPHQTRMDLLIVAEPASLWRNHLFGTASGREAGLRQMKFLDAFIRLSTWAVVRMDSVSEA